MPTQFPFALAFAGLLVFTTAPAFAQAGHAHHASPGAPVAAGSPAASPAFAEGVVRRVNAATGTVTIAHGPLTHLDMPPMTMGFRLAGAASLAGLSTGDQVRFVAGKEGRTLVVTQIEKLPQ
jgi:Cu(I)/Ag(I) efflux system periplasmic protein CusF